MAKVPEAKPFTPKQGQYLAFIYYDTKMHGRPPAEADFQRFFRVTPPVVHEMIKTLTGIRWRLEARCGLQPRRKCESKKIGIRGPQLNPNGEPGRGPCPFQVATLERSGYCPANGRHP